MNWRLDKLCRQRMLGALMCVLLAMPGVFSQTNAAFDTTRVYQLKDDYPKQSLFEHTEIYFPSEEHITIQSILEKSKEEELFVPLEKENADSLGNHVVWLKVSVFAEKELKDWWLILKRANPPYEYLANVEYVEVYYLQNDEIFKETKTGVYIPASQKEIVQVPTVSIVPIQLTKGSLSTIYVRIQDRDISQHTLEIRNPEFPLNFKEERSFLSTLGISASISAIIAIYTLFFFFYSRDYSYLYLFGMLGCLFLHYFLLHYFMPFISWFIPEHPTWSGPAWNILTHGTYIFFLQFGRTFSNLKKISPYWDKVTYYCIWFIFGLLSFYLFLWTFNVDLYYSIGSISAIPLFLIPLLIIIRLAWFKDTLVRYFVFGGIWLFFFSILGILWENELIPFFRIPNPWTVAQVGFMLIYALALARKLQISEKARAEVDKVKAIDAVKSRFFANISHEFRTPLSLILGPINQSLERIPASESIENETEIPVKGTHLKLIKRNATRLHQLVDQILDLSKLDQGKLQLQVAEGDVIAFIRAIVFSFESLAERKHIHFSTQFPAKLAPAYFDRDKLEKILANLLSNAFKFTPEHGEVGVQVSTKENHLIIQISDSGSGMNRGDLSKVFDRFYQAEGTTDQGTGIGLSLVKELVELHRGQIRVDSTEGQGTSFKLSLPFQYTDFEAAEIRQKPSEHSFKEQVLDQPSIVEQETSLSENSERPLILVVEDNPDLRNYIAEQLQNDFEVISSVNGVEGQQAAEKYLPDLIISDVMMPKMNGLELCEAIKTNIKTSHIPLILLTAKAGQDAKILGLETGADDYLTKPFDGRELRIRAQNLVEQRALLREKFANALKVSPTEVSLNSMDETFIRQVMNEVEQNMDNEYYSVEDLASAVGFSRSQLNRKLKGLLGKSPNQLIREFRLTRAKQLLEQKSATVSEIAFQVGYSSLSYFTKSYKDAFGITPSDTFINGSVEE